MSNKKLSFMQACKDHFGLHPEQTSMQFAGEIKKLTPPDRAEIQAGLEKAGYEIIAPTIPAMQVA